MFVMFIAMIFALYWHDTLLAAHRPQLAHLAGMVVLPRLAAGLVYLLMCRVTLRRLATPAGARAMRWLDRIGRLYHLSIVLLFVSDLRLGLLATIRHHLGGDWVLLDELLALLPSLAMIFWGWVCHQPVDRRLREASLMRRLDAGQPASMLCTPGQYILNQLRHQVLVVLIPLLALYGWHEVTDRLPQSVVSFRGHDLRTLVSLLGALAILLLSPVMLRHLWDTVPLPPGPLRQSLADLCQAYGVRVRQLLLWRTYGTLINAAVMGVVAPVRYIMLTDALLENIPQRQVEAVMAHEVAHIRRRHMIWLVVSAAALLMAAESATVLLLQAYAQGPAMPGSFGQFQEMLADRQTLDRAAMLIAMAAWFASFGWVSRRFERQADTFAVQHLATTYGRQVDPAQGMVIDPAAADAMVDALQRLAILNHVPVHKNSWRHGSILWRQQYLRSLVGRPVHQMPIDATILAIKLASALVLLAGVAYELHNRGYIV